MSFAPLVVKQNASKSVEFEDGTARKYQFFHKDGSVLLKVTGFEPIYKIGKSIWEEFREIKRKVVVRLVENIEKSQTK